MPQSLEHGIKFYFDKLCQKPIDKVKWDKGFSVTLANGKEEKIENMAEAGSTATATFYVRNEADYKFGVHELSFPDYRVNCSIEEDWLYPMQPVKVTLSVKLLPTLKGKEIVESAQFIIKGFFVIDK